MLHILTVAGNQKSVSEANYGNIIDVLNVKKYE